MGENVYRCDLYHVASFRVVSQHHWDPAVAKSQCSPPLPRLPPTPLLCPFPLPSHPIPSLPFPSFTPTPCRLELSALRMLARTKVTAVFFFFSFFLSLDV